MESEAAASERIEPPLLSQDEFFRHLQLQSVHTKKVKYTYRQALKERLRANPKKVLHNNNLMTSVPAPQPTPPPQPQPQQNRPPAPLNRSASRSAGCPVSSPSVRESCNPHISPKWLSPQSCRRIFVRPNLRREKKALDFNNFKEAPPVYGRAAASGPSPATTVSPLDTAQPTTPSLVRSVSCSATMAASPVYNTREFNRLKPLLNNCILYRHPKIAEEIEALALAAKQPPKGASNAGHVVAAKSTILQRRNYLKGNRSSSNSASNGEANPPAKQTYQAHIRIQPNRRSEDAPLAPLLKLLPDPSTGVASSVPTFRPSSPMPTTLAVGSPLLSTSGDTSRARVLRCRHCPKEFSSLKYHEGHRHQTCPICRKTLRSLWRKSRSPTPHVVCRDCAQRFPLACDLKGFHALPQILPLIGLQYKKKKSQSGPQNTQQTTCDLCTKVFFKRDQLIRHLLSQHSSELHKVELSKFVDNDGNEQKGSLKASRKGSPKPELMREC